ncbi:MAG: tripartite tricarboxylate transporter substrate binding protein [Betaproteobacteria bacterium]|nr:tripartite tricarboxylate transporter substrate binding protein [Betaproteobacteria bacterium]
MKSNLAVCFFVMLAAAGAQVAQPAASAGVDQNYPTRPIRLIVPQAPGGSNDIMARFIGNYLTERLGRQVVVDNRPGAEGMLGTEIVARSAPDGYTLLMVSAAFTMNPAVRKVPYDPLKAFDWVAMLGSGPTVLTVGPSLPVSSVQELLAAGKAKPGYLNMAASTGAGHFWSAFFRSLSGVDLVILVYKGGFPAMIDVMGGQAHMTVGSIIQALPYIRSGKLKPLATGGAKRSATLPDLPTIAEAGVPGYTAGNWWALAAAAGTPPAIIARINTEVARYLNLPETRKRFTNDGAEVDIKTPGELRKMILSDMAQWAKVAKETGMRTE